MFVLAVLRTKKKKKKKTFKAQTVDRPMVVKSIICLEIVFV